jgi:hypothetical protein
MGKRVWFFLCLMMSSILVEGQKRWNGGDAGNWDNASNWVPSGVPSLTDEVILDNSLHASTYVVTLPLSAVSVHSLRISPRRGSSVSLVIPKENVSTPALTLNSEADAVVIDSGGVLLNSSGLASGSSLRCAGLIRINNGGRYIHNSRSIHANDIVGRLSSAAGTEGGIFEFDVPAASTTVSLSNRVFGKLVLSASANGGNVSYNGSGVNPLVIRSDLEIGTGVNFSISFSNTVTINRKLVQKGGTFNIANAAASTILAVGGDVLQEGGTITKTGSGIPVFLINGTERQYLAFYGRLLGNIIFRTNNPGEIYLHTPLILPYRLELIKGIVHTSNTNLLTLVPGCTLAGDSTGDAFIHGPLRKEGLIGNNHFLFPVGKHRNQRWLALKNASGNFVVEYENENPSLLSGELGEGLHHISTVERWSIAADSLPLPSAQVELSFDNVNSGGVSELSTLKVSHLVNGRWNDEGTIAFTGTAGTAGSVVSKLVTSFESSHRYYTLGSSVSGQNTLPLKEISVGLKRRGDGLLFNFSVSDDVHPEYFILQGSDNGIVFTDLSTFSAIPFERTYLYLYNGRRTGRYYRIITVEQNGYYLFSRMVEEPSALRRMVALNPSIIQNSGVLSIYSGINQQVEVQVADINGKLLKRNHHYILKGENRLIIRLDELSKGVYTVRVICGNEVETARFLKQ